MRKTTAKKNGLLCPDRLAVLLLLGLGAGGAVAADPLVRVPGDTTSLQTAISQVDDGGVIEIAGGTYLAPAGGFVMNDLGKGFTMRAAGGADVVLDGGGSRIIFRFQNSAPSKGKPVLFEGLTFANGFSDVEGLAGAISLYSAEATFADCTFRDNRAATTTTVGGAVYVTASTAFFVDTLWTRNESKFGGAGLGARSGGTIYVHRSVFLDNRANPPGHNLGASGGAINVGDSVLRITDSRFESNQAGAFGGALYAIGTWTEPVSLPRAHVIVANSTFLDNHALRDPSVASSVKTEGGAVNAEDQTTLEVYNSRFVGNSAMIGGGVNLYRAEVTIRGSVFQGNQALDPVKFSGFGGAISATSGDVASESLNRRSASLTVEDTLIQGRHGAVEDVAPTGGGIYVSGDIGRIDGAPGVPDMGTVAENRAQVVLRNVVVYECDITAPSGLSLGGGILAQLADLTLEDSQILSSDAGRNGGSGAGGGLAILYQSATSISGTTFARNAAATWGGAVFVQGSTLTVNGSRFFHNEEADGFGAAIFSTPDVGRGVPVAGTVSGSVFSSNLGLDLFDDDRAGGPVNDLVYNSNQFFTTDPSGNVYRDSLTGWSTVPELNALVVHRNPGISSTDKSKQANSAFGSPPILGTLTAVPSESLPRGAAGDPAGATPAYLGFSWSGGNAKLDGGEVTGNVGLRQAGTGSHTLQVGGSTFTGQIFTGAAPSVSLTASPASIAPGGSSTLSWSVADGTLLDLDVDRGVDAFVAASGATSVSPPLTTRYRVFLVTEEGGDVDPETVTVGTGGTLTGTDLAGLGVNTRSVWYSTDLAGWKNVPGALLQVVTGDFDGDGLDELAGRGLSTTAYVSFDLANWSSTGKALAHIVAGDFDGDGADELAGLDGGGGIWYTTNLAVWTQIPGRLATLVAGDFDGDGRDELAGVSPTQRIYFTEDMSSWIQISGALAQVTAGDFDGDGRDELAGVSPTSQIYYTTNMSSWIQIPGFLSRVVTGDFDADGRDELAGISGSQRVYYTTAMTSWTNIPGNLVWLATGDFDQDGRDEIAGTSPTDQIYYTTNMSSWIQIPGFLDGLAAGELAGP